MIGTLIRIWTDRPTVHQARCYLRVLMKVPWFEPWSICRNEKFLAFSQCAENEIDHCNATLVINEQRRMVTRNRLMGKMMEFSCYESSNFYYKNLFLLTTCGGRSWHSFARPTFHISPLFRSGYELCKRCATLVEMRGQRTAWKTKIERTKES